MEIEVLKACTFEIVVGTYEEFVVGYIFNEETQELIESFATHSHQGSVRCISCSGALVASGGSDEMIQLYNMVTRKEVGTIMQHTGTVTSLQFTPEQSHLISCSQDGSIAIHRVGNWQLEKVWATAHKGAGVNCIAIHPSSKMALSLAQNKTLRTWNLIKGRPAYTTNLSSLGKFMDFVVWSTEGSYFALSADNKVYIFDATIAGIISTIECTSRITSISFFDNTTVCFGEENGWIVCHCIKTSSELWRIKVSDVRVKCISFVSCKWLVTSSSDGTIIVWKIDDIQRPPVQISSVNIGCRVICMSVRIPVKVEND